MISKLLSKIKGNNHNNDKDAVVEKILQDPYIKDRLIQRLHKEASLSVGRRAMIMGAIGGVLGSSLLGEAVVDDAKVIQSALDVVVSMGGGVIKFDNNSYQNVALQIMSVAPIIINLNAATLKGDGTNPVISIKTNATAEHYPTIIGGIIDGNNRGSDGIKITDSYHVIIRDTLIQHCNKCINMVLENQWVESTIIDSVVLRRSNIGINFENIGSTYNSFAQTRVLNVDIGCDKGIVINQKCSVYGSTIHAMVWLPDNGVGVYMDGASPFTDWFLRIESQYATAKGIVFGSNYDDSDPMTFTAKFYGALTEIDNPNNKKYIWMLFNIIRAPSGIAVDVFRISREDGTTVLKIHKNATDSPVFGTYNSDIYLWDYGAGRRAGIQVYNIGAEGIATIEDLRFNKLGSAKGVFPIVLGTQSITAGATALAAKFTVPTGKTLKIHAIAELYDPDGYISAEVYNVTDAVTVASADGFDDTGWEVASGKVVEFRVINSDTVNAHDGNYDFLVSFV